MTKPLKIHELNSPSWSQSLMIFLLENFLNIFWFPFRLCLDYLRICFGPDFNCIYIYICTYHHHYVHHHHDLCYRHECQDHHDDHRGDHFDDIGN